MGGCNKLHCIHWHKSAMPPFKGFSPSALANPAYYLQPSSSFKGLITCNNYQKHSLLYSIPALFNIKQPPAKSFVCTRTHTHKLTKTSTQDFTWDTKILKSIASCSSIMYMCNQDNKVLHCSSVRVQQILNQLY